MIALAILYGFSALMAMGFQYKELAETFDAPSGFAFLAELFLCIIWPVRIPFAIGALSRLRFDKAIKESRKQQKLLYQEERQHLLEVQKEVKALEAELDLRN